MNLIIASQAGCNYILLVRLLERSVGGTAYVPGRQGERLTTMKKCPVSVMLETTPAGATHTTNTRSRSSPRTTPAPRPSSGPGRFAQRTLRLKNLPSRSRGNARHLPMVAGARCRRRAAVLLLCPAGQARAMRARRANCGAVRDRRPNDSRCIRSSSVIRLFSGTGHRGESHLLLWRHFRRDRRPVPPHLPRGAAQVAVAQIGGHETCDRS